MLCLMWIKLHSDSSDKILFHSLPRSSLIRFFLGFFFIGFQDMVFLLRWSLPQKKLTLIAFENIKIFPTNNWDQFLLKKTLCIN